MKYCACIIMVCLVWIPLDAWAKTQDITEAQRLYADEEDYIGAASKYNDMLKNDPNSDIINFNLGAALYKSKQYEEAIDSYQRALLSDEKDLRAKAHYNLGNSFYQHGISFEKSNVEKAIEELERGVTHYDRTLDITPGDKDAEHNLEFVKNEIERLKQMQEMQQQNQQSQQSDNDQDQNKQQQQQENQKSDQNQDQQQQSQQQQQQNDQNQDQQQQSQQQQQQDQQQQDQNQSQSSNDDPSQNQQSSTSSQDQPTSQDEITQREAQRLLEEYQLKEEPKGLLQLYRTDRMKEPIYKDW